jgi:ABC-2 type transport system ATP-binding protein
MNDGALPQSGYGRAMVLATTGVTRTFGRHVAVAGADLSIGAGSITGLVGPNGAGKTTLLLMLAGLLRPDAGVIALDGAEVDSRSLRSAIGWMPDVFGTWDSLTTTEILSTFGQLHGLSRPASRNRATELLELVHLTQFADRPAHELSRGQKQRLGFARTLVHRPRVLLLDEPASGMDPRSRVELRDQLRALADDGCAVLISSHILTELSEMVDDVIIMTEGRTRSAARQNDRRRWRIREAGQSAASAVTMQFPNERAAALHLTELISAGRQIAEFARIETELEDAYLALDTDRT